MREGERRVGCLQEVAGLRIDGIGDGRVFIRTKSIVERACGVGVISWDSSEIRQRRAGGLGELAGLQVHRIDVYDYGDIEIRGRDVGKRSGAVDPEAIGVVVFRQLDVAKQGVSANSEKLDDTELEEIVLRAGDVVAALGIHRETEATLRLGCVRLKPGYKTRLWINGERLKLPSLVRLWCLRTRGSGP